MFRLKPRGKEKGENWILRKVDDEFAGGSDDLIGIHLTSVDSGRTMEEIAAGKPIRKQGGKAKSLAAKRKSSTAAPRRGENKGKLPPFQPVQLAALVDHVPPGDRWLHELKYDGYRTLIAVGGGEGRAFTRSGLDWSDRFAGLTRGYAA